MSGNTMYVQEAAASSSSSSSPPLPVSPPSSEDSEFWKNYWEQFKILLWKNCLILRRRKLATLVRFIAPLIFVFFIWVVQNVTRGNDTSLTFDEPSPAPIDVSNLQDCSDMFFRDKSRDCYTFAYSPTGDPLVEEIVMRMKTLNGDEIPPDKVIGFANSSALDQYLLENPQTVQAAVNFETEASDIRYTLQTNSTPKFFRGKFERAPIEIQVPLQHLVEKSIAYSALGVELDWGFDLIEYPHPIVESSTDVSGIASFFLFGAAMFSFVTQANTLVGEKETGVRKTMVTAGMSGSAWWLSWMVVEVVFVILNGFLIPILGNIFGLLIFTENSFGIMFFTFFLFGLAMAGFGFLVSIMFNRVTSGTTIGFVIYIVGFIIQITVGAGFPYDDTYDDVYRFLFSLFPPSLLALALSHLDSASDESGDRQGIRWSQRYNYCYDFDDDEYCMDNYCQDNCAFSIADAFLWWTITFFLMSILAVYFDYTLGAIENICLPWNFFVSPYFWYRKPEAVQRFAEKAVCREDASNDEDVRIEEEKTRALIESRSLGRKLVEIYGIEKVFGKENSSNSFHALKSNWFTIDKDELFCLLGPNGAGKTTTINCLIGNLQPSYGFAVTNGYAIPDYGSLNALRRSIGVCPQFDGVYPELTAVEHLLLIHWLKCVYGEEAKTKSYELLSVVNLSKVSNTRVGAFSGGMRRRLSLAMSMVGNPSILYLDEPTTGMDPISRRQVWDVIMEAKANRAIILTTHSMEEADILGDRIAIMARGRLRCIGTSNHLKNKFGAGYRLSIPITASSQKIQALLRDKYSMEPAEFGVSHNTYTISRDSKSSIPLILNDLSTHGLLDKTDSNDIQIRLTTLEEVFLKIARDAEAESAQIEGTYQSWQLPDGRELLISAGMERIAVAAPPGISPSSDQGASQVYNVQWTTDDEGRLRISGVTLEE